MNSVTDYALIGGIALLVLLIAIALILRSRSAQRQVPSPRPAPDLGPGAADEATDPALAGRPTIPDDAAEQTTAADGPDDGVTVLERPESVQGRLTRLRARLARSNSALGQGLLALLSRDRIDDATWDEIEETLLMADVGVAPAESIVAGLRQDVSVLGVREPDQVRALLRNRLLIAVGPDLDRSLATTPHLSADGESRPAVMLVVGVNGSGKTTTVGKLARVLVAEDKDVVLGAADTFRAAAADQLTTWGERVGVPTIRSDREGADPAAVAYDAVKAGIELDVDVVLIDTAGRLQNKVGLMDELGKVKRVIEKHGPVDEVLLVLDATTGQNGMQQAKVFSEVVDVTGIVLTKLDGTAKGGIVIAVQQTLGVPVKLVGLGEGPDDLAPFEPGAFVDAIMG